MGNPTIDAHIHEINGARYDVKLHAVPAKGDLISLYSFLDDSTGDPANKYYEVVQVLHSLHDVTDRVPNATDGSHYVNVFVVPSVALSHFGNMI